MKNRVPTLLSLRAKFMFFATGLVFVFAVVLGALAWNNQRQMLVERLEVSGSVLVSSMAIPIINALLYEELELVSDGGLLDNFILTIIDNPELQPVYALAFDTEGKILAHSQMHYYGDQLTDSLTRQVLLNDDIQVTETLWQGQKVLDVGEPLAIHGKRWGGLRVGLPLAPLYNELDALTSRIINTSFSIACIALLIFYITGERLARPLRRLAGQMEQVGSQSLTEVPPDPRRDEIGLLHRSFRQMISQLIASEKERDKGVQQLLENERLVTAGRIVAGVAHEINNPLAGIQGALYTLQKKPETLEQYHPLLLQEVDRISSIVHQLLDISSAGELELSAVETDQLTDDILRICQLATKDLAIEWVEEDRAANRPLICDARKIQQVALNLAINAADALRGEGTIRVMSQVVGNRFCWRIADNGPGIPQHLRQQIFTPFFTTKAAGKGTGIGLAFCVSTVEKHGGKLRLVDSVVGASFEICLPLNRKDT